MTDCSADTTHDRSPDLTLVMDIELLLLFLTLKCLLLKHDTKTHSDFKLQVKVTSNRDVSQEAKVVKRWRGAVPLPWRG